MNADNPKPEIVRRYSIGIGTLASQKKREKLFWECIFALLNLKRKIKIEGQQVYCSSYIGDSKCHAAREQLN